MFSAPKICFALFILLVATSLIFAQDYQSLSTKYTTIYYVQEKDISDFFKSILSQNRLDRIVERVEELLDMYPEDFHIDIILATESIQEDSNFYSHRTKSITIPPNRVTEILLAHAVATALINFYFETPPPAKMQEILIRYVDEHLGDQP